MGLAGLFSFSQGYAFEFPVFAVAWVAADECEECAHGVVEFVGEVLEVGVAVFLF